MVQFNALEPFIPSGKDFKQSKELFLAIGFTIMWEADDYIGFKKENAQFILQNYNDKHFAENLMMNLKVNDLDAFWDELNQKELSKKFAIKLKEPTVYPWGREINMIDLAGVCWHISS
jgi:hypothetical protein